MLASQRFSENLWDSQRNKKMQNAPQECSKALADCYLTLFREGTPPPPSHQKQTVSVAHFLTLAYDSFRQGCARDLLSWDQDEIWDPCLRDRDETETFKILSKTRPRRCSFRDAGFDLETPETLESLGSFNVSLRRFPWRMGKHIDNEKIIRINSHHGQLFLFVILWVFALYFDNNQWIINVLHHKELQLQCCRHEPLCLSQLANNWN